MDRHTPRRVRAPPSCLYCTGMDCVTVHVYDIISLMSMPVVASSSSRKACRSVFVVSLLWVAAAAVAVVAAGSTARVCRHWWDVYSYRRGPLMGDDHHSCRLGVCLLMTHAILRRVVGCSTVMLSTPCCKDQESVGVEEGEGRKEEAVRRPANAVVI